MGLSGWTKKPGRPMGGAPGTLTRPHSEADFSELDENAHLAVDSMNDKEIDEAFEKMLVSWHSRRSIITPDANYVSFLIG